MSNRFVVACAVVWAAAAAAGEPAAQGAAGAGREDGADPARRLVKDGVVVDFSIERRDAPVTEASPLREGDFAEVRFRVSDASSGQPLRGQKPAAWMDLGGGAQGDELARRECKDKVALYLRGVVGIRPLVDLNSYFVLVLNRDPSITVIDPVVSMTGKTSLYATVPLKKSGADWARSPDHKRIFVTMPRAGEVAVVDTESFRLVGNVAAGREPTRALLDADGRRLWVGNDAPGAESGVTLVDVEAMKPVAHVPTGRGHHELALSPDGRFAFVTNRDEGTLSVVDVARLAKVKDVKTGSLPISVAISPLSQAVYVADGKSGKIAVVDPARHEVTRQISARPGLGPMRFSDDGRWGFVPNPAEHAVHVVDAAENRLAHTIPVDGKPYQVSFTPTYAYVRLLDSERVPMISVASLGKRTAPTVQSFAAGTGAPQTAPGLPLADAVSRATTDNAVFVANPVDNSTYFYMEGMNAPSGSFVNYGHQARAVSVVDRTLKEIEPGLYAGRLRIPAAGRYDVAFLLDSPRLLHCFSAEAKTNPLLEDHLGPLALEYVDVPARAAPQRELPIRFRLTDPRTHAPRAGLGDVTVLHYRAPGRDRTEVRAREVGEGLYEATARLGPPGAYYLFVTVPSLGVRWDQLPFRSVLVSERAEAASAAARVALADAPLVDQDGAPVKFRSEAIGDRIVVVDFVFTTCTTVCPALSAVFTRIQERLGDRLGRGVELVSVSLDPARDTPERLKAYAARHGAGPHWSWLTGRQDDVEQVLKGLGAYTANFSAHVPMVLVGDGRTGVFVRLNGFPSPDRVVEQVDALLAARAVAAAASPRGNRP